MKKSPSELPVSGYRERKIPLATWRGLETERLGREPKSKRPAMDDRRELQRGTERERWREREREREEERDEKINTKLHGGFGNLAGTLTNYN